MLRQNAVRPIVLGLAVAVAGAYPYASAHATRTRSDAASISVNIRVENDLADPTGLKVSIMQRYPETGTPLPLGDVAAGEVKTFSFNSASFGPDRPAGQAYRLTATADRPVPLPLVSTDFTLNSAPPTDTVIWSLRDGISFRMQR
jgi:hypothetical protein